MQWIDSSSYENFWESLNYLRNAMKMMMKYEKSRSARKLIDRRDAKDAKRDIKDIFENNRASSRVAKSSIKRKAKKRRDRSRKQ